MAFREKTAWLALGVMILAYGGYFIADALADPEAGPMANVRMLILFGIASVVRMVLQGGGYLILRARFPQDARTPPDERDRAIARRGYAFGYGILLAGMIGIGMIMPFTHSALQVVNAALAAIVIAEITCGAVAILSYRRGWHG